MQAFFCLRDKHAGIPAVISMTGAAIARSRHQHPQAASEAKSPKYRTGDDHAVARHVHGINTLSIGFTGHVRACATVRVIGAPRYAGNVGFLTFSCYNSATMTAYGSRLPFTHTLTTGEKKQERRKLLAAVEARRKQNYQRYMRKLRDTLDKSSSDLAFD